VVRAVVPVRAKAVAAVDPVSLEPGAWRPRRTNLPLWPLWMTFAGMPVWWALGVWYLIMPFFGIVLLVVLTVRGRVRLPSGTTLWLTFLGLVVISGTQLDKGTKILTYGLRMGYLVTATLVAVYVYNLARDGVAWRRIANPLALYWLAVVALGWFGVLAPKFSVLSPFQHALPEGLRNLRFINDISRLDSTEFNAASDNPIYRPAAPYPYTNNWGTAYAFLVPFVLAYLSSVRRGRVRFLLIVSLPLSVVPAFLTLNRGMFIGLGAGMLYLVGREFAQGRFRLLLPMAALVLIGGLFTLIIPVGDLISARTSSTDTNIDRYDLYRQTWAAVMQSPLFGFGQPASVDTTHASEPLGTQGMLWQVLYSHGIPALICLYLFLAVLARRMALAVSATGRWLSMLPVIAVVVSPFYAYIDPNMAVLFAAVALGLAALDGPVNREPRGVPT
jgi:polysaccharide biosynthesis protein PslJ